MDKKKVLLFGLDAFCARFMAAYRRVVALFTFSLDTSLRYQTMQLVPELLGDLQRCVPVGNRLRRDEHQQFSPVPIVGFVTEKCSDSG